LGLAWADKVAVLSDGGLQFQDRETYHDSAKLQRTPTGKTTSKPSRGLSGDSSRYSTEDTARTSGGSN